MTLPRLGINVKFAKDDEPASFESLIDSHTKALYVETIGNPRFSVPDFRAQGHSRPSTASRSSATTPSAAAGAVPTLRHGADIVVESATKWIGGHGTTVGGVIVDGGTMNWNNGKHPIFTEPSPGTTASGSGTPSDPPAFGRQRRVHHALPRRGTPRYRHVPEPVRIFQLPPRPGDAQPPHGAPLREHDGARQVPPVAPHGVLGQLPGLSDHPFHRKANEYFRADCYGAVLTFGVKGGLGPGTKFIDSSAWRRSSPTSATPRLW